jgi:anti-sigma B factor antagonist
MSTPLTLTSARRPDGRRALTVSGEIDMSNSRAFAAAIEDESESAGGTFLLDLTRVGYLDSAGLSILLLHAERVEILAAPLIAPVLTLSGLPDLTTVRILEPTARTDEGEPGQPA